MGPRLGDRECVGTVVRAGSGWGARRRKSGACADLTRALAELIVRVAQEGNYSMCAAKDRALCARSAMHRAHTWVLNVGTRFGHWCGSHRQ